MAKLLEASMHAFRLYKLLRDSNVTGVAAKSVCRLGKARSLPGIHTVSNDGDFNVVGFNIQISHVNLWSLIPTRLVQGQNIALAEEVSTSGVHGHSIGNQSNADN